MGLSTAEFAVLTPFMFNLICKGYTRRLDDVEAPFRMLGWINFQMGADPKEVKKITVDMIWPKRSSLVNKKEEKADMTTTVSKMMAALRLKEQLKQQDNG